MSTAAEIRDNLVIGGGLAGAMTAFQLASAGKEVVLLEKERSPRHKVCGEFLSPEAVGYLSQAKVDLLGLGAAHVDFLRLSIKNNVVETHLPFRALSLSRCVLDAALLARAAESGCDVRTGVAVQRLDCEHGIWTARSADGSGHFARNVFLATGKHDIQGWSRPAGSQSDLVGFKMHWHLRPGQTDELRGMMDLYLFRGGYGGLSLVEEDVANLCLVIRRSRLRSLGGWQALLAALRDENELVSARLDKAEPLWDRPLAVSSIPYGYLAEEERGFWRVGDQAAVIPSFTGDGMAIALHSGVLAAEMSLAGQMPVLYHSALRAQLKNRIALATLLSIAMVSRAGGMLGSWLTPCLPLPIQCIALWTRIPDAELRSELDPGTWNNLNEGIWWS